MLNPMILVYVTVVLALFALLQGIFSLTAKEDQPKDETQQLRRKTLTASLSPDVFISQRIRDFENLITVSNIKVAPIAILASMGVITVAVMTGMSFRFNPLISFAAALGTGIVLPLAILAQMRNRRVRKLVVQLPDALDMMVRSLRAGHPVPIGVKMISTEMSEPISGEFKRVYDSMAYGLDLKEAFEQMGQRLEVTEFRYMIAAIRIQFATGGNLSEILSSLASVMRERVRLKMKVRALSAESRVSANIMSVMPFLVVAGMYHLHPEIYKEVPTTPLLQHIMEGAAGLITVGIVVMRRVINFRV